jgi:phasin family protein
MSGRIVDSRPCGPAQRAKLMNNFDTKTFDDMQKFSKESMDASMNSLTTLSKGVQALAVESVDYTKKAFEDGTAAMEKLFGAKSIEKAMEIQQEYAKSAYEGFVAQATKVSELYVDLAKEAYKPYEGYLAKMTPAK